MPIHTRKANREDIAERTREGSISKPANYANTDFVQTAAFHSTLLFMVIIAQKSRFA